MKQNRNRASIDGFIPRRSGARLGDRHENETAQPIDRALHTTDGGSRQHVGLPREDQLIGRSDIDESLRHIDDPAQDEPKKLSRRQRRKLGLKKPKSKRRRIIFWIGIGLLTIVLAIAGFLAYRFITNSGQIFQGNIFDILQSKPLKEDANGRSNFLVFGTAEDDENGEHSGANLTDSIMVISVDQDKKDAYMLSLPRDLWVEYQAGCSVGYQGKINAAYFCASNDGQDETAGAEALGAKVTEITGLDIQYYVHLNFTAVVEAVDAVGGVDVTIESEDPRGILDRNFDWKCNYTCYYVNYKNGEQVHLDGQHALALARARNASGGYGLPNGNFDREKNQQKIITALREKALSVGTLTNLGSVTALMDAMGKNLRTNIETNEIQTLMGLARDIQTQNIISLSLVDEDEPLVTTDSYNGQSIVRPVAGVLDYSDIQEYVDRTVNASPVSREESHISVLNGGRAAGAAQIEADKLTDADFIVDTVDNAPDGDYAVVEIYQLDESKTASATKLKQLYGVDLKTETPPVSVVGETDFIIILGVE